MKIAYLITAYANFEHLNRLFEKLNDENVQIFVHIDKKSDLSSNLLKKPNIHYIPRIKVWWGGFSHLQAILNLMKAAIVTNPDYLVLISGGDYPIKPKEELYKLLSLGGDYMNMTPNFTTAKPEWRMKYFFFDCFDRRSKSLRTQSLIFLERIIRKFYTKKNYPFEKVYHGSTWWALSSDTIRFLLKYLDEHPVFLNFFKTSWCPEESIFQTIIGNSSFIEKVKYDITYADWTVKPGPGKLNEKHLKLFEEFASDLNNKKFFARKFDDNTKNLTDYIDSHLLKSSTPSLKD